MYEDTAIMFDNGSSTLKAGYALIQNPKPQVVLPTCVGRLPSQPGGMMGTGQQESYFGHLAQSRRSILTMKYPIENGIVTDWDDMEEIWRHIFDNELKVAPDERHLLMTGSPIYSKTDREAINQIMFEKFKVPAMYMATPAVLAVAYWGDLDNGIVVDSGDGLTRVVPIHECFPVRGSSLPCRMAGKDVSNHLVELLTKKGYSSTITADLEIVRDIKKLCFVSSRGNEPKSHTFSGKRIYNLPNGATMDIESECYESPEILFHSNSVTDSLQKTIVKSIERCDREIQTAMYSNIFLVGGNTMLEHLPERLSFEVARLAPYGTEVRVKRSRDPILSAWVGGVYLTKLLTATKLWVTREEYDESGIHIVNKKCFLDP